MLIQKNTTLDTLTYWLKDSSVYGLDTLSMEMTYLKTDSLFNLVTKTDTINVFMRKAKDNPKARQRKVEPKQEFYKITTNLSSGFDVYNPVFVMFDAPLNVADLTKVKLRQKIDSTYKDIVLKWRQTDSTKMVFAIDYKWEPEKSYELKIDSAAFVSIYKLVNNKLSSEFKIKSLEEYAAIKVIPVNYDSLLVFQVLDTKDAVLASKKALLKGTFFEYLKPGDYYIRAFLDVNKNGKWDTGDLLTRRQPEEVFYNSKKLSLRANWEFEESWDVKAVPLLQQKPAELKKDGAKKQGN